MPCEPLVQAGERVLMGQKIAGSKAVVSSPVHSSVSGAVKGFRDTLTPSGAIVKAIAVENDGLYDEFRGWLNTAGATDHRVLLEEIDHIISGLKIMLMMFKGAEGIIAIESNKRDAIVALSRACETELNINVKPLKTKYPQGLEKHLAFACTGRQVPSGGLHADAGIIVNNVDTVIAIDRAIRRNRPLIRRVGRFQAGR